MSRAQLYIIAEMPDRRPIKIGRSVSAKSRLASLQTGNCRPLDLAAVYTMDAETVVKAEKFLHEELAYFALVGEWFDLDVDFMARYIPDFFLSNGFEVRS
jgi:hypothetical protein